MRTYQSEIRVPRWRALRALLTRRGLVLRLSITADGSFTTAVDVSSAPRPAPRWHAPEEVWEP